MDIIYLFFKDIWYELHDWRLLLKGWWYSSYILLNCWDKNGITVLYVHCIPGGQTSKECLKYFDLDKFYVILFDQRGCGKSDPRFCIANNDTKILYQILKK